MRKPKYDKRIFVNCPFDKGYAPIFNAVLFAIFDCGFVPRCTKEIDDASEIRIESIFKLIDSSRYCIHDISRTEVDPVHNLPRFNMPLELGIFLGSKKFGGKKHSTKACLILDRKSYRYQKFISDIGGQDIESHGNKPKKALTKVRDWLGNKCSPPPPSGNIIWNRYQEFQKDLPTMCKELELDPQMLTYGDYTHLVPEWLRRFVSATA